MLRRPSLARGRAATGYVAVLDMILRGARLEGRDRPVDIAIEQGRIAEIAPEIVADVPARDLNEALVVGGLVETHLHLDKSRLTGCGCDGSLQDAIAQVSQAKAGFSVADIYDRGRHTLEAAILQGTNRIRTHVEVDPRIGLRGFEAMQALKRDYAWAVDLQICVFPQEGLTNDPGCEPLLREALRQGADLLGGCPYTDTDPRAQIDILFQMAQEFDVDLDLHLDFDLDPSWFHLDAVLNATETLGWQGRVTVGHVTKLSMLPPRALHRTGRRMAGAGVALCVLPATDLYLSGRDRDHAVPRGVAPARLLSQLGVRSALSTNNVLNPFTPFGDCSLLRIANLFANVAQIGDPEGLAACFGMVSDGAANIFGTDSGIAEGRPAHLVVLDAQSPTDAVARVADPLLGLWHGRPSFEREKGRLLRPAI